jgi:hypothetical protein
LLPVDVRPIVHAQNHLAGFLFGSLFILLFSKLLKLILRKLLPLFLLILDIIRVDLTVYELALALLEFWQVVLGFLLCLEILHRQTFPIRTTIPTLLHAVSDLRPVLLPLPSLIFFFLLIAFDS